MNDWLKAILVGAALAPLCFGAVQVLASFTPGNFPGGGGGGGTPPDDAGGGGPAPGGKSGFNFNYIHGPWLLMMD